MREYILASKSPRRKALLRNLIDSFLIIDPDIKEARLKGETPEDYVLRNAALKAQAAAKQISSSPGKDWVVIAADTIVVDGGKLLGKPADESQAARMLADLRGGSHTVFSGLAVYAVSQEEIRTRMVSSEVPMREYTEDEINAYVASGDPMDKAGAYAIQNHHFNPAPDFSHCYANVMGLPLCTLAGLLHEVGCPGHTDVAQRCQKSIQYQCPVFSMILSGIHGKESA